MSKTIHAYPSTNESTDRLLLSAALPDLSENARQLAPKTISPGRSAPSLWTIRPSLWTIRPQSLDNSPHTPTCWRKGRAADPVVPYVGTEFL